jgi:hypothetical protein
LTDHVLCIIYVACGATDAYAGSDFICGGGNTLARTKDSDR